MNDCLFCKIAQGEIPSTKVYEDEKCYAFLDINPQARKHIVLIPREHAESWTDGADKFSDQDLAHLMRTVSLIAKQENLHNGYRVISNCGPDACQSVRHWHLHILGGEQLSEKMA